MNPQRPSPVVRPRLASNPSHLAETAIAAESAEFGDDDPPPQGLQLDEIRDRLHHLTPQDTVLLIQQCMTRLQPEQLQTIVEFGQQELANRQSYSLLSPPIPRETSLLLKKDYSYQDRGLSEPTQYYVYLRRRKPKLDRYIGTLFYVPQGCTLTYVTEATGRILFQPPHNVFHLTDAKDASIRQIVRLVGLEPPPANYSFIKQQHDTPAIYLRLAYLDPFTLTPIAEQSLPFPSCMHEGGALDRYRWDVTLHTPEVSPLESRLRPASEISVEAVLRPSASRDGLRQPDAALSAQAVPLLQRSQAPLSEFYLCDRTAVDQVLERMQLWVAWSEKAMPQSSWAIVQNGSTYTLINANFQRSMLSIAVESASVTLHGSLPVIVKWFHDLSLAVSQSHNQRLHQFAQLKLAHNLFVEMSLPQTEPVLLLKQLFGVEFWADVANG
ncbi:MAG: hypothetical protein NW220_06065 [Leptolyngbyaceae cyanobacterium bins.349]|nr:hypothetical protein [Leptolyngbyaceae cyanobacterium bins.349]